MPFPLLIPMAIGAIAGGGLAAGLGPKQEPIWKRLLVGGALGATAGLGAGAALGAGGAGAAGAGGLAAGEAGTSATVAGSSVGGGSLAGSGIAGASTAVPTAAVGTPEYAGIASGLSAVPQGAMSVAPAASNPLVAAAGAPEAIPAGMSPAMSLPQTTGQMINGGLLKAGNMIADNPMMSGTVGLGIAAAALPGGEHIGPIRSDAGYGQDASWQQANYQPIKIRNYDPVGGLGRGAYFFR